ncbi:MAG: hypothetical protein IPJ40_19605 [Saprospirales bacterium]|nr:hypothetical protein [Saprospirales bacterium]
MEPQADANSHEDSYGYRPGRPEHEAVGQARKRCWRRSGIAMDIKAILSDNIDHNLLNKALAKHVGQKW